AELRADHGVERQAPPCERSRCRLRAGRWLGTSTLDQAPRGQRLSPAPPRGAQADDDPQHPLRLPATAVTQQLGGEGQLIVLERLDETPGRDAAPHVLTLV